MDPVANLARQCKLAAEIVAYTEDEGPLDQAIDGESADAEYDAFQELAAMAKELAELVQALDEWRQKGGFDPYS